MATQTILDSLAAGLFARPKKSFLSFREAASESTLSERTLRRLHERGTLNATRVGNRLLISRESFEKLLSQ